MEQFVRRHAHPVPRADGGGRARPAVAIDNEKIAL
jgi:hypothetical protein